MFPLDTRLLTPRGLVEVWELFPGDYLVDSSNTPFEIIETEESEKDTLKIILEDNTTIDLTEDYVKDLGLSVGEDLIIPDPVRFIDVEERGLAPRILNRREGINYGAFGLYEFIPHHYLMDNTDNRKMFFEGLLFSQSLESHTDTNEVIFLVKYPGFAEDLLYLIRSLGGTGDYHMFFHDTVYYEVTIQLPKYFEEGVPTRKITDIKKGARVDTLELLTEQSDFILNHFIKVG